MSNKSLPNPNSKKIYFRLFAILLVVLFFGFIEITLRLFSYGNNLNLFIPHPEKYMSKYYTTNQKIGEKYFIKFDATGGVNDVFLKQKTDSTYRIFVMGSSTVVGFPYDKNLMFSRILHQRLIDAYPNKNIEMVNTALTAINSITLLDFMREIVKHEPDALVFYAGHNEFYGAFGIGSNETLSKNKFIQTMHFKMMHLRFYQLLRNTAHALFESSSEKANELNNKGSLMKRIVANKNIEYQGDTYNIGINQFRNHLTEILKLAKANRIDVFISDLVSDVKDIPPFGSAPTDSYPAADSVYKQAWNYYNSADYAKAESLFYFAKDLDMVRFRASEQINEIIDSLSKAYNCHKVSTKAFFKSASPNGIIGHNLMTEHLHPNISGQFVLADAFYAGIVNSEAIATKPDTTHTIPASFYRVNWPYTELDSLIGFYKVNQLKSYWPFTSVDESLTFRDKHKISGLLDSLAFQVIATKSPYVPKLHEFLASDYVINGEFEKALHEYKAMNKISPYWSIYYNKTAICYLKLDDLYNAEKCLNDALKYSPNYLTYLTLAEIESIKHNFKLAKEYFILALENTKIKEERIDAMKKLCFTYSILGEIDEKTQCENKLKKTGVVYKSENTDVPFIYSKHIPTDIKNHLSKSSEYLDKQQFDSARFWINQAILVNDCPVANYYMGELLKVQRDKNLLPYYQKAYQAYRFDAEFLHSLFIAYLVNSNFEKAKHTLNELKNVDPNYNSISNLEKLIEGK